MREAKAACTLRRDLTLDDVFLPIGMIGGAMRRAGTPAARATAAVRAHALLLDGLTGPAPGA